MLTQNFADDALRETGGAVRELDSERQLSTQTLEGRDLRSEATGRE